MYIPTNISTMKVRNELPLVIPCIISLSDLIHNEPKPHKVRFA